MSYLVPGSPLSTNLSARHTKVYDFGEEVPPIPTIDRNEGADQTVAFATTGDFYVNKTGADTDGLSEANAFRTIDQAITAVKNDGTMVDPDICIGAGVYEGESLDFYAGTAYHTGTFTVHRKGTDVVTISGMKTIAGSSFVQCGTGDEARLGDNYASYYKYDVPAADIRDTTAGQGVRSLFPHYEETPIPFAQDVAQHFTGKMLRHSTWNCHLADGFGRNGGYVTTITDASVLSKYTALQLIGAEVYFFSDQDQISDAICIAFDDVDTITLPNTIAPNPTDDPQKYLYGLYNVPANGEPNCWAYDPVANGDGSYTIYIWPTNAATLIANGIEICVTTRLCDFGSRGGHLHQGLDFYGSSGRQTVDGGLWGHLGYTYQSGGALSAEHCTFRSAYFVQAKGYALGLQNTTSKIIKNCTIKDAFRAVGVNTNRGSTYIIDCKFTDVSHTPVWYWGDAARTPGQDYYAVVGTLFTRCALDAHANKAIFYDQLQHGLSLRNKWVDCFGYYPANGSCPIYHGFCEIPSAQNGPYGGLGFTAETRVIDDTNGTFNANPNMIWNCYTIPNQYNYLGANWSAYNLTDIPWIVLNNITPGIVVHPSTTVENNIITIYTSGDVRDASNDEPTNDDIWTSVSTGDFSLVAGSVAYTKDGQDITAIVTQMESVWTDLIAITGDASMFRRDFFGEPINIANPPMGHYDLIAEPGTGVVNVGRANLTLTPLAANIIAVGDTVVSTNVAALALTGIAATVSATGSVNHVLFDAGVWTTFAEPTVTSADREQFIALGVVFKGILDATVLASEGAFNTRIFRASGAGTTTCSVVIESSLGSGATMTFASEQDTLYNIVVYCTDGAQSLYVNNILTDSDIYDLGATRYWKFPTHVNTVDDAGTNSRTFELRGPVCIANGGPDAFDVTDYYDGNGDPIMTATTDGMTFDVFKDLDAAGWNADPETLGDDGVTDV